MRIVVLCSRSGCRKAASYGPHCQDHRNRRHRSAPRPSLQVAVLTAAEIAALQTKVAADAAPLFLVAMSWIATQQMHRMGMELPESRRVEGP